MKRVEFTDFEIQIFYCMEYPTVFCQFSLILNFQALRAVLSQELPFGMRSLSFASVVGTLSHSPSSVACMNRLFIQTIMK